MTGPAMPRDLQSRLRDPEDRFVERKPERAGKSDFKRTLVAFANSVPANRTGVLFVGVGDRGEIQGVENPDRVQKDLRHLAENDCYPPIYIDTEALVVDGKVVVAAVVGSSPDRPHFAGHAYIRRGSESVSASKRLFDELILSREDKRRVLLEWRGTTCTVQAIGKPFGEVFPMGAHHVETLTCTIEEVTAHYVRLRVDGRRMVTEILEVVRLSWDDQNERPRIIVKL
jgi:hypothetical protein